MNTFAPYPDLARSAASLDRVRLWKQVIEAEQLVNVLTGETAHWKNPKAWTNHPAAVMWRGAVNGLKAYFNAVLVECLSKARGINTGRYRPYDLTGDGVPFPAMPWWWGEDGVHASHRANLLRKDPVWYGAFGWAESPDLPHVWPAATRPSPFDL